MLPTARESLNYYVACAYPVSPVPEDERRRLRAVGYDAGEVDRAALVHVDVRGALDPNVGNWKRETKEI